MPVRRAALAGVWEDAIGAFLAAGREAGLAAEALRVREGHLARFARAHEHPWLVEQGDVVAWLAQGDWAATTTATVRAALRTFYGWAVRERLMTEDPTRPAKQDPIPAAWREPLAGWFLEQRAAKLSRNTLAVRRSHLKRMATARTGAGRLMYPDPLLVTRDQLVRWMACSGATAEYQRSLRSTFVLFWGFLEASGRLPGGVKSPAASLPRVRVPRAVARPADDIDIVAALRRADRRTLLMLRLAAELGLRRAEVGAVDPHRDVEMAGLRVCGKGGVTRVVPLPAELRAVLTAQPPGWLFPSSHGGHLTAGYVGKLMAEVLPTGVTPHMLRHAAATAWHDAGLDIADIQPLLGHASMATTGRYVQVRNGKALDAVEQAAARLRNPRPAATVLPLPSVAGGVRS